jgi:hypothetical protein
MRRRIDVPASIGPSLRRRRWSGLSPTRAAVAGGDGGGVIGWRRFAPPLIRAPPAPTFSRFAREGRRAGAPLRGKKRGGEGKMRLTALMRLVSGMFLMRRAGGYQGLKPGLQRLFASIPSFFLEKFGFLRLAAAPAHTGAGRPDSPAFPALSQLIRPPPILFLAESNRTG